MTLSSIPSCLKQTAILAGGVLVLAAAWVLAIQSVPCQSAKDTARETAPCYGFVDDAGKPLHPMLLTRFLPTFINVGDDNGDPTITSLDVNTSVQDLSEVPVRRNAEWVSVVGGEELRYAWPDFRMREDESFRYRVLGRTSRGLFVVETLDGRDYSALGHVWLLFFRLEKTPSINWRSGKNPPTTHLRLEGFRMPKWRRCTDPDCGEEHTDPEGVCDRVWAPKTRLVGDRLESRWEWEPNRASPWAGKTPPTPPATEIFDLSDR